MSTNNLLHFYSKAEKLAELIKARETELQKLLQRYETRDAADDEIKRSIETLKGAERELSLLKKPLSNLRVSTFFPLNLPLYSLVLFGIMPSAFAQKVFIRPPEIMNDTLKQLWDLLEVSDFFPALSMKPSPRHLFIELYASDSDVVIFTGKYKNALDIHEKCPDSLLVYNGSGVNPFIVFENANVVLAAQKAVEMRCFNSGQDCAGPDAFFVHRDVSTIFINELQKNLENINVGSTEDPKTNVGPIMKNSYIQELERWIADEKPNILFGGKIDHKNKYIYPTIIKATVRENGNKDFHEFFAPFFYVVVFENEAELQEVVNKYNFNRRAMYVSYFGKNENITSNLDTVKLLHNKIVNDVEKGNEEYGGYGKEANFLLFGDTFTVQPILISRDVHKILSP
ncbi:MAG: aldehyde dehydrogenase family protein [Candidatus Saccharibacteria bacterium]|nr:aldehyde dehydrogenase family protein [Candidatus Saccharibacteria bacterium]